MKILKERLRHFLVILQMVTLTLTLLAPRPGMGSQEAKTAVVQLKWHHQTQFAGLYVAAAKGLYRKEGVEVQTLPWKMGPSPIEQVVSGAVTFGITSHTQFLVERGKGAPIVAIAAIYQKSPVGFFALKTSGVKHPKDFVGHSIAFAPTHEIHLKAMLKKLNLDFQRLKPAPYSFDLTPWFTGQVEIWAGYIMNQPVDARLAGHEEVTIIFPDDYGVYTYDDIIFTSEAVIRRDPSLVERWLRAMLRGWQYAVEHPEEATDITLRLDPTLKREKQMAMLLASIPLIHTGQFPIGWMTREVWEGTLEILLDQKILQRRLELDKAYTTTFLEQIYRK